MTIPAKAQALITRAEPILATKKFVKARYLAKKLEITSHLAGQLLAAMPEWTKYTNRGSRNTWIKGTM